MGFVIENLAMLNPPPGVLISIAPDSAGAWNVDITTSTDAAKQWVMTHQRSLCKLVYRQFERHYGAFVDAQGNRIAPQFITY